MYIYTYSIIIFLFFNLILNMQSSIFDCDLFLLMAVFSCHLLSNCSRIICMFSTWWILFASVVHTVPLNKVQAAVFLWHSSALLLGFSFPWWDNPAFCFFYIVFLSMKASLIFTNWILTKGRKKKKAVLYYCNLKCKITLLFFSSLSSSEKVNHSVKITL